jgi:hypothetical protein
VAPASSTEKGLQWRRKSSILPISKPRACLRRIDHPVNEDTELHPLVRLQFIGGIPEAVSFADNQ